MTDSGIGNAGAMALANAIQSNNVLEVLDISFNDIDYPDARYTVKALWQSKTLKRLNVTGNRLCRNDSNDTVFPEGLPKNTALERLGLGHLNSADFLVIVESLNGSTCIQTLYFCGEGIISLDDSCGTALRRLLESSPIQELSLDGQPVTSEGKTALVEGFQNNTSLRDLCLSGCFVNNKCLLELGEALVVNTTLEILDLTHNVFDAENLSLFFGLLPRMKGLKTLMLSIININNESVGMALLDGLRVNSS